jgi:hypothetical protein
VPEGKKCRAREGRTYRQDVKEMKDGRKVRLEGHEGRTYGKEGSK